MRRLFPLALLMWCALPSTARSQVPDPARDAPPPDAHAARRAMATAAAKAIHRWVEEFVRGRIDPKAEAYLTKHSRHDYVRLAAEDGVLDAPDRPKKTTHFSILQRLVARAESFDTKDVAEALLALAACGYSNDLYSSTTIMVRDLGHFALMRSGDPTIWNHIFEVATGEAGDLVPLVEVAAMATGGGAGADVDDAAKRERELHAAARIMRRVAAVRLLGMKGTSVFRVGVEKCLDDPDPRIRLAAAEAFGQLRDLKYLYTLTRRVADEPHPMVVMGLLSTIERTLKKYKDQVPISRGMNTVRELLPVLGKKGWRNDMTIVRLVRQYPVKPAIPALIHLMRGAQAKLDPLLEVVNKDASPVLADEIFQTLRQTTGALLPPDPNKWHEFWEREQQRLQLVAPYRKRRAVAGGTRGTFFGIPVVGREVVFVIDTSGSMKEEVARHTVVPKAKGKHDKNDKNDKKKGKPADPQPLTRLDAAKQQMLNAVQGIPTSTLYHLVTFSGNVRVWNQAAVKVGPASFRTLTQALSRLGAGGGTNVYAALLHVLGAAQMRYGQQIDEGVEEVFFLSDGEPSVGVVDRDEILRVVREINRYRKIRINVVFTGVGKGAAFLRRLAVENHGVFVQK